MALPEGAAQFKLVLIGEGGVGKTTFVKRVLTGDYTKHYDATIGAEMRQLPFYTNRGPIVFNVWDTAGQEKYAGLRDGYYLKAQACIIMFDLTARGSYLMVPEWHKRISRIAADIPTVLVGNKVDVKERMVKARQIRYHRRVGIPYFDISAKTNYNAVRPFLKIACILARDESLRFTEAPVLLPAEFQLNEEQKRALEADRVAADAAPLPEGDDFD
ncbi:RAN3 [Symbiodinium sp. KB8]|nr:RAN3 [Symbiodinium sp. KB8]